MEIILHEEEKSSTAANILKLVFIIVILAIAMFFGLYSLICKLNKKSTRFLGFFNSVSGGIFLGIGLFVLLPESQELMEGWTEDNVKTKLLADQPYCFFVAFLAYSFMLFIEKVLFNSQSLIPLVSEEKGHSHGHHHEEEAHEHEHHQDHAHEEEDSDEEEEAMKNVVSTKGKFASFLGVRNMRMSQVENREAKPMDRSLMKSSQILTRTFAKGNQMNDDMDLLVNPAKSDFTSKKKEGKPEHVHDENGSNKLKQQSNLTTYLLLAALCLDGFFEGIALGVQGKLAGVLFVAAALVVNKIAVAFSLGVSFKKADIDLRTFIRFILLFSLFTPVGIAVGYFAADYQLAKGILLSISTGTFIYVSCSVVIVEEFAITRYKYSKYLCFLLGAIITAIIALFGNLK